ncbi:phosphoribosylpyrophosphate synthetase [Maribacter sp. 1_MG-2023]|uniref:phosphoribosylpyrophosphate synthetase n=1 Tax=Maribacter sp. 1_MG-2023 TaxID=3062677 RepID=UPI0026E46F00|nr:phosphoribosylpyrophosphate synthetase [Maribacter sp. 1_MG-2023]MDO6470511.1 phosphoribosylpyrophosphate synthetase [Maribacter sp. 1_MG-2023]
MENSYISLFIAIKALQEEAYPEDFNLCDAGVENKSKKNTHNATQLEVVKFYRFEGMSNPDDNTILYVIETSTGEKGLLVDGYGMYAGNVPKDLIEKLKFS